MKRINIETEKPYKMGDAPTKEDVPLRDGKFFYRYDKTRTYTREPREGCYFEYWYTAEQLEKKRIKTAKASDDNIRRLKQTAKREINPATGEQWKRGEVCPDRGTFYNYKGEVNQDGMFRMAWARDEEHYNRKRMATILSNKPKEAKRRGIPFDLELDYLISIFPKDMICPALGIKMEWGTRPHKPLSPSIDRIDSTKGYVKGNVAWISYRANTIKHDATHQELESITKWLKKEMEKRK